MLKYSKKTGEEDENELENLLRRSYLMPLPPPPMMPMHHSPYPASPQVYVIAQKENMKEALSDALQMQEEARNRFHDEGLTGLMKVQLFYEAAKEFNLCAADRYPFLEQSIADGIDKGTYQRVQQKKRHGEDVEDYHSMAVAKVRRGVVPEEQVPHYFKTGYHVMDTGVYDGIGRKVSDLGKYVKAGEGSAYGVDHRSN